MGCAQEITRLGLLANSLLLHVRMFRGDLDGAADVQQFIDEYLNGWMGFLKVGVQVYQMYMGGAIGSTLGHHKIR